MLPKILFSLVLVVGVLSDNDNNLKRVKRGKYYSSAPSRFYRKPPPPHVIKGAFSYTPPPFVDERPKSKIRRPVDDGLADEDISNLVKHLSKKDLDKIVEFASDKDRYTEKCVGRCDENSIDMESYRRPQRTASFKIEDPDEKYRLNGPFSDSRHYMEYINYVTVKPNTNSPINHEYLERKPNFNEVAQPIVYRNTAENKPNYDFNPQDFAPNQQPVEVTKARIVYTNSPTNQDSIQYENSYKTNPIFAVPPTYNIVTYVTPATNEYIYTNSSTMKEEELPKPLNLREDDDYLIAHTNNVPTFVQSDMYKVESFKDVPLMNYVNSKLHSVSSYSVPHYTVTSTKSQQPTHPQHISQPLVQKSQGRQVSNDESDAHLKAVKIWTHHSTGAAYTLHDDGTLTAEKSRPSYGK